MATVNNMIKIPTYEEFLSYVNSTKGSKSKEHILAEIRKRINNYEMKYKMTSDDFIVKYERGDFEMDDNYLDYELLDWSGSYKHYKQFTQEV